MREEENSIFRPAVVHSLFQMEKSLNNVILKHQALCEYWKPLAGSWLGSSTHVCPMASLPAMGETEGKRDMYETSNSDKVLKLLRVEMIHTHEVYDRL